MLVPDERRELECFRCGKVVDSACGGYWYLLLAPRGRVKFPAAPSRGLDMPEPTTADSVLCAFCGRELREFLEGSGYAPGESYERSGQGDRARVPGTDRARARRGARSEDVVDDTLRGQSAGVEGFRRVGELLPFGAEEGLE